MAILASPSVVRIVVEGLTEDVPGLYKLYRGTAMHLRSLPQSLPQTLGVEPGSRCCEDEQIFNGG